MLRKARDENGWCNSIGKADHQVKTKGWFLSYMKIPETENL
jgi:hypothetical protein